ncbi:hypothetical protein ES708_34740 [subsurface metagenome]
MDYKKNISLIVCQDIERLVKQIRQICHKNSDIVKFTEDQSSIIRITDLDDKSSFFYEVKLARLNRGITVFIIEYKPKDELSIEVQKITPNYEATVNYFNQWIEMIKQYNAVSISPVDRITEFYEKEFYSNFDIVDDDADINPFDLEKQLIISRFVDSSISLLKENNISSEDEIIVDLSDLKENQQNYTKRIVIRKLSIIFTKIKKRGIDLLKLILKEASKELIKKAITEGIDFIGQLSDKL